MTETVDDPYRILGVARTAGEAEIRTAYERRLRDAAAVGALRTVQQVDAAFTLLRDPRRRALFDRDGHVDTLPRLHPDQRWAATRAVPFRQWSPPDAAYRRPRTRRPNEALRNVAILVVVLAVVGAGVKFSVLRNGRGSTLTDDVWATPVVAAAGVPLLRHQIHRQRLLPAPIPPRMAGPTAFLGSGSGSGNLTRWDPCQPIRYVISGNEPFPGATSLLMSAIIEVSADTGLQFDYAGTTAEVPSQGRAAYQPERYGKRWAPVLVAWTDASTLPALAGRVVGIGGGIGVSIGGASRYVSGIVALDDPDLARMVQQPSGRVLARAVILHELGHLVGLGHVRDRTQVMNPSAVPLDHFGGGDRNGLATLGSGPCPSTF